MNKLQMAHEFMMKKMETETIDNHWELFYSSWRYADAMQAEADKREKEESEKKRADIREMLKDNNTFVEREGQHFDDVCSDEMQAQRDAELYGTGFLKVTYDSNGVKYKRLDPETIYMCSSNIGIDSQVLKEWQPDWSQAPTDAYEWLMVGADSFLWRILEDGKILHLKAPSFNYQGHQKDSLRKRPQ